MSQSAKIAFTRVVREALFPNNAFYLNSVDHTSFVDNTKVVIPVSGGGSKVVKNPSVFPLAASGRLDDTVEYMLDLFATLPRRMAWDEKTILNYPKMDSMTKEDQDVLNNEIAENFLTLWLPTAATRILRTSGAAGEVNGPEGSTGNRKKAIAKDLKRMRRLFNKMNIPQEGRYGLLDSDMEGELTEDPEFVDYDKTGRVDVMKTGAVGMYAGFTLYSRSRVGVYNTGASAIKAVTDAVAATDCNASLFWHKDFVTRALGQVKTFMKTDEPSYLGDIFNFAVRAGGRRRSDDLGVAALVQAQG